MELIIAVVVIFLVKCWSEYQDSQSNVQGDFICPKCGRPFGVERGVGSMVGTTDPWHRFRCKKCGFRW